MAKRTLDSLTVPYQWIDLAEHPDVAALVLAINGGKHVVPTVVLSDGTVLVEPDADALTSAVNSARSRDTRYTL